MDKQRAKDLLKQIDLYTDAVRATPFGLGNDIGVCAMKMALIMHIKKAIQDESNKRVEEAMIHGVGHA